MKTITSEDNKYIKLLKSLQNKKYRQKNQMFFDEGIKNILLSLNSSYNLEFIFIAENFYKNALEDNYSRESVSLKQVRSKLDEEKIFIVKDKIFTKLSDTINSQGIIAIYKIENIKIDYNKNKILILDRLQDPGNVGTILRTADAFNIDTVLFTKGTVDFYSPKVIRSTMGSLYFINFCEIEDISVLRNKGFKIYASCLEGAINASSSFTDDKIALIIGNEANGISKKLLDMADKKIKIDIKGNAESLNAAIATGILIYEMTRSENE